MRRRSIPRKLKETLLAQSNNQCSVCGAKSHLEVAHIRPLSLGGDNSPENLIVLCPTCHVSVDRSGLNPDILSSIKKGWTERHVQGRGEVLKAAEEIRRTHAQRAAEWIKNATPGHEIAHWGLTLQTYKEFDTHIDIISSEIQSVGNEDEFVRRILKPLFDGLGFHGVTALHHTGIPERGKDIVFYDRDKLGGLTFYAVVACNGRIHANSAKTNDSGHYQKILDQVSKCFQFPYREPNLKSSFFIDKVVIACPSSITDEAMEAFALWEVRERRHLIYLPGPSIAGLRVRLSVSTKDMHNNGLHADADKAPRR